MPTLTAKQRLQTLVAAFGAREGLRRLLALDGVAIPGAADGGAKPVPPQPLKLPAWITDERAEAIVAHFLHGELLLPWHVAAFWQDQWVAEGWPMVGAATVPSWEGAAAGQASAGFQAWQAAPVSAAAALKEAAQAPSAAPPAALPPVPPQLWATLVELHGNAVWLWTKYRKYFHPVAGKPPLLAGVLLEHEVAQGTLKLTLQQASAAALQPKTAVVEVDCFAYTLAVAIGVLESTDFATVHNVMPKCYPSQWQASEPAATVWVSPLHGDARFWHEFDEPPVGDRGRFVRQGLTRQEAVRVWARRVAVCLWGDANGHWGRWPWRLADASVPARRLLLGWDPMDKRIALAKTHDSKGLYGLFNSTTVALEAEVGEQFQCEFGQAMWQEVKAGRTGELAPVGVFAGSAIWDMNPYIAWSAAWHSLGHRASSVASPPHQRDATHQAAWWLGSVFQQAGVWHGPGWLAGKTPVLGKSVQPKFRAWYTSNQFVCSFAEVLDLNMAGCHTNAAIAVSLARAQCVAAMICNDNFLNDTYVTAVSSHAKAARVVTPESLSGDSLGQTHVGHRSLMLGYGATARVVPHSDNLLADRGGSFCSCDSAFVPIQEHWVCLMGLFDGFGSSTNAAMNHWTRLVICAHWRRRSIESAVGLAMNWQQRREAAATFDAARSSQISRFATARSAWFDSVVAILATANYRRLIDDKWTWREFALDAANSAGGTGGAKAVAAAAIFLGFDSKFVMGDAVIKTPAAPSTNTPYLSGAPWSPNWNLTGSTGLLPWNFGSVGAGADEDRNARLAILEFALLIDDKIG